MGSLILGLEADKEPEGKGSVGLAVWVLAPKDTLGCQPACIPPMADLLGV